MYDTRILVLPLPRVTGDTSSVTAAIKSPNVVLFGNRIDIFPTSSAWFNSLRLSFCHQVVSGIRATAMPSHDKRKFLF